MHKAITYLFLPLYLAILLRPVIPFLSYSIHQNYIARVLCENKEKPLMQCNGACHLKKQIKEAEPAHNSSVPVRIVMEESPVFLQTQAIKINLPVLKMNFPELPEIALTNPVSQFIWKPPQLLV